MEQAPYHLGFTTLDHERHIDALPVDGSIPPWLAGTLVRTGPARYEVGGRSYNHWFDGLAMLHAFTFSGGQVGYANRFLHSRAYDGAERKDAIAAVEFGTDPCRTLFERVAAFFKPRPTDNCNVSINQLADDVVAFTETPLPLRFDPETLETLGVYDLENAPGDEISGVFSTAHPHFDAERSRHYNYITDLGRKSTYNLYGIAADGGRQEVLATIDVDRPAYMHSFGMSERYLILTEFPLVVNPLRLLFRTEPIIRNFRWRPERGVRFHVIDKDTGERVAQATSEAFFAFHHVNAFEDGDTVVVDMATYPDPEILDQFYLRHLRSGDPVDATARLSRHRIDLADDGEARPEELSPQPVELPRIHYDHAAGRPYRYVYATGHHSGGDAADFLDNLVKLDLQEGSVRTWYEPGCYPGEPVFVAAPDSTDEDAGLILSVVLNVPEERSFLLVLDADTFEELGRAVVPHHVPFGFHGNFLARGSGAEAPGELHR